MSTKITAENGAEIEVGQLGITVAHPEGTASIWARLTPEQRRALAAALHPVQLVWTLSDVERSSAALAKRNRPHLRSLVPSRADIEKAMRSKQMVYRWLDDAEFVEVGDAVDAACEAIGVESEQVVDPVSELAARLEEAARDAVRVTIDAMKSVIGVDLPFTPDDLLSDVGPDYWRGHAREIMDGDGE